MTEVAALNALLASGIVQRGHAGRFEPGDQSGVLDPATIEVLASMVADSVPNSTTILLTGPAPVDALLAYLVGKQLHLRSVVIYDAEGVAMVRGRLPVDGGNACFVTAMLHASWQVDEFDGICRVAGIEPVLFVALVDILPTSDHRVTSVLRIASS